MQLRAHPLEIEAGGPLVVVMSSEDAKILGANISDRLFVRYNKILSYKN